MSTLLYILKPGINIIIIRSHRHTTYIGAACCYRPSSVVCQSVCHSHEDMLDDTLPWVVQKWLNQLRCLSGCGLGWAEVSMFYMAAHWRHLANTIEPCAVAMRPYVKLLWPLVTIITINYSVTGSKNTVSSSQPLFQCKLNTSDFLSQLPIASCNWVLSS